MTELNPVPVTLVCGVGSHARSVFLYMHQYNVRKICMVYSKYNKPEFDVTIKNITKMVNRELENVDHLVEVRNVTINERQFNESFITVSQIYDECKHTVVITDLTAGHKIISYIMFYAHSYSSHKFLNGHKIVYLFEESDVQIDLPTIDVDRLNPKVSGLLMDMSIHVKLKDMMYKIPPLTKWLTDGIDTKSGNMYTEPTIYRYKKELRDKGLVERDADNITMKGRMYLATM